MNNSILKLSVAALILLAGNRAIADTIVIPLKDAQPDRVEQLGIAEVYAPDATHDTMAYEGSPSSNYCSSNQFEIGRYDENQAVGYLNFEDFGIDLSATVTRIALRIYKNSEANNGPNHQFYFAQIDDAWSECSLTWNSRPGVDNLTIYGPVDLSGPVGWYEIQLPLSYATAEINEPNSWHGISIGPWRTDTDLLRFRSSEASSSRPYLIVEFDPGENADLVITNPNAPTGGVLGQSVTLSCAVANIGVGTAGSSNLGYFISPHNTWDSFAIQLGDDGVSSLPPGDDDSESLTAVIPTSLSIANNPHYILFVADLDNDVAEPNGGEDNNVTARPITLHVPPTITGLHASQSSVFESEDFLLVADGVSDADDAVVEVQFWWDSFQDGELDPASDYLIGSDTTPSTWELLVPAGSVVSGNMTFFAVPWDAYGLSGVHASVVVTVVPSLYPVSDVSKPNYLHTRGYIDSNNDGMHSPGEHIGSGIVAEDNSCWMATAANLITYRYGSADYDSWCEDGIAESPALDLFGGWDHANSGDLFTFDDTGFPHWVLRALDIPLLMPIMTTEEFEGGVWEQDPIAWCRNELENNDRPVALLIWWGAPPAGTAPGWSGAPGEFGYHAITLWGVDDVNQRLLITDSDDSDNEIPYIGTRNIVYDYVDGVWVLPDYNTEVGNVYVNYACVTTSSNDASSVGNPGLVGGAAISNVVVHPNPFNPHTYLRFDVREAQAVDLNIYDVKGRRVRELLRGRLLSPGSQEFKWDGLDDGGRKAASGVYVYRISTATYSTGGQIVLTK